MPNTPEHVQDTWITDRIRNQFGAGEGTTFPPKMIRGIRVPLVSNFKVLQTVAYNGGTQATLSWDVPDQNATLPIGSFLLSLKGTQSGSADVVMAPVTALTSPAIIRINSSIATVCTVSIQTVLTNGQTSLIDDSPTVSINTIAPVLVPSDIPASTLSGLNLVLGYSNLTTAGGVTYVTGTTGEITEDPTNFSYDSTNKRLGLKTNAPKSTIDNLGSLGLFISSKTSSYTAGDVFCYLNDATSATITVTLPTASTVTNRFYLFKKTDSSANTVVVGSAFTLSYQNESILICSNGSTWINLIHSIL